MKKPYTVFVGMLLLFFCSFNSFAQQKPMEANRDSLNIKGSANSRTNAVSYKKISKKLFGHDNNSEWVIRHALEFKQPYMRTIPIQHFSFPEFAINTNIDGFIGPGTAASKSSAKQLPAPINNLLLKNGSTTKNNNLSGLLNSSLNPGTNSVNSKPQSQIPGVPNAVDGLLPKAFTTNQNTNAAVNASSKTPLTNGLSSTLPNPLAITGVVSNSNTTTNPLTVAATKAQLPQAEVKSLLQVPNPLAGNNSELSLQNISNTPTQLLGGTNSVPLSKDQMLKMAALRSQLLTGSISKNLNSINNPTFATTLTLENDLLYQPVLGVLNGQKFENVVGIKGSLMAFGIPLNINISNNQAAFNGTSPFSNNLFKFGFSPSMFSGLMKSDLQQYASLKNSVFHGFDFTDYVHQTITEKMSSMQSDALKLKDSPYSSDINDPAKLQSLIQLSDQQLKEKLEMEANDKYTEEMKSPHPDTTSIKAERQMNYARGDSLATVIGSIKGTLQKNGVDPSKLLLAENYSTGKTSSTFNSSELANSMFTKKPSNSLQSMLGNVKDLRVGSFGEQVPGETGENTQLINGANLGIRVGDYPLTIGYGTLNDINSLKDAQFQTSVYAIPKNITYIGAEMNRGSSGDVKIAVVSSFNGQSNNVQYSAPTLPGNAVAITATKALKVDDFGNFTVDVSKSGTLFSNSFQPGAEAVLTQKAAGNYNLSTNLFQSFAVGFTHDLTIPKLEASDNLYFNYAGLGYQNPANNGYSGSTVKFGGNIKKKLYKNKLTLGLRTDYRTMPLSYVTNDTWRNYQVQFDSRYQITQKFNVSLKYIDASTAQNMQGISTSVYSSSKFELSANDSYKIGKYFTNSQLSISSQSLTDTYESASGSSLININYAQSLMLKNSSITGTFFYNKELSAYQLIGDLVTTDITYQYKFLKNIQLASGITYLNNTNIAKQAGIRQSLQFMAGKHFDVNASVDLRKNLITPQYADLYSSTRGELSLKYYFKIN